MQNLLLVLLFAAVIGLIGYIANEKTNWVGKSRIWASNVFASATPRVQNFLKFWRVIYAVGIPAVTAIVVVLNYYYRFAAWELIGVIVLLFAFGEYFVVQGDPSRKIMAVALTAFAGGLLVLSNNPITLIIVVLVLVIDAYVGLVDNRGTIAAAIPYTGPTGIERLVGMPGINGNVINRLRKDGRTLDELAAKSKDELLKVPFITDKNVDAALASIASAYADDQAGRPAPKAKGAKSSFTWTTIPKFLFGEGWKMGIAIYAMFSVPVVLLLMAGTLWSFAETAAYTWLAGLVLVWFVQRLRQHWKGFTWGKATFAVGLLIGLGIIFWMFRFNMASSVTETHTVITPTWTPIPVQPTADATALALANDEATVEPTVPPSVASATPLPSSTPAPTNTPEPTMAPVVLRGNGRALEISNGVYHIVAGTELTVEIPEPYVSAYFRSQEGDTALPFAPQNAGVYELWLLQSGTGFNPDTSLIFMMEVIAPTATPAPTNTLVPATQIPATPVPATQVPTLVPSVPSATPQAGTMG